ncbi:MAG: hypothetical protein K8I30_18155 [Anaerolineae bacterium]|nr:hypothetical protein [Anaerolineae bacterium]
MRTLKRLSLFVLILTVVLAGTGGVFAQDAMMEPGTVVCDADLILSLYNAEYHFDYAAVHDKAMAMAGESMAMEAGFKLTDFDYGQFAPLFDGMMTMMDDSMSMGMTDEATMTALVGMMSMSMEDMEKAMMAAAPEDSMMAEMTALAPGDIAGEPAQCTALRANLRQFYVALAAENAMSMMAESS